MVVGASETTLFAQFWGTPIPLRPPSREAYWLPVFSDQRLLSNSAQDEREEAAEYAVEFGVVIFPMR
jgi:hypothetical protein